MRNPLRPRFAAGKACLNGWLNIPSGLSAEVMAKSGWHSLTVDLQHGLQDVTSMVECFRAISSYPTAPMVRISALDAGLIGKVLDAGAWGIICPMVNTAEQARAFVDACLYPPAGNRSNGPILAQRYSEEGASYQSFANEELLVLPMIETRTAVENLESILDVPGISGVYVGPADLGLSLGMPAALDREDPEILDIYGRVLTETSRRNLLAGIHTGSPTYAARMISMGFRLVTMTGDTVLLGRIAQDYVRQIGAAVPERI